MKTIPFVLVLFLIFAAQQMQAQEYFEGEIEYTTTFEVINKKIPLALLITEMGDAFTAYIKEDKYIRQ